MHSNGSMNRVYRVVWNAATGVWQAVCECAKGRGKTKSSTSRGRPLLRNTLSVVAGTFLLLPLSVIAADLPTGGQIVAGSGAISQSGTTLTVTQASDRLAANWQSFSIGQGHSVNFVQPSASAVALNRVLGADVSVIQGALNANGQVFLVNPNGVLFTPTAQVNVGALVASTLNLSTDDFLAGNYRFSGGSSASVNNQGEIKVGAGGTVALIAARIENTGSITAPQGNVLMGAGSTVRLDLGGLVKLEVQAGALDTLIEQGGAIRADGGLVYLTARAAGDLASSVINHSGVSEARTLATGEQGEIILMGDMAHGTVNVAGRLDASAPAGGQGGFIETSAHTVQVADGTHVKAGHWLIDPVDFTIGVGVDGQTISGIGASTLAGSLGGGTNVTIQTDAGTAGNGDIFVNSAVTWNAASKLTLSAHRDIAINADITAQNAGGQVQLEYGQDALAANNTASYSFGGGKINLQAGDNFFTKLGSNGSVTNWKVITSLGAELDATSGTDQTLQGMARIGNLGGNYVLGANIDASTASSWDGNQGFVPVGVNGNSFTGRFDGLGHTITGLTINRPGADNIGLFGHAKNATLRNVGLVGGSIKGNYSGSLVGYLYSDTGGTASISNSYATGSVTGITNVGGLAGYVAIGSGGTSISISKSYATGAVSGTKYIGGLVGGTYGDTATNSISNSYATGAVSGTNYIGGLVGQIYFTTGGTTSVSNSYATGAVLGSTAVGGLVGDIYRLGGGGAASVSNSFWDTETTGKDASSGIGSQSVSGITLTNILGKTSAQMQQIATFTGWDSALWSFGAGQAVAGYGAASLPFLTHVTRSADMPAQTTLFDGGWGGLSNAQQAGADGSAYGVSSWAQLANINQVASGNYSFALNSSLDNASTGYATYAAATANSNAGWLPIGNDTTPFVGRFDGLGHTISDLEINRPTSDFVGLFGYAKNASISNVGLIESSLVGGWHVGGLVGVLEGNLGAASITNSYVAGSVRGENYVGGLAGTVEAWAGGSASIAGSYATGTVSGTDSYTGGLVGSLQSYGTASASVIINSYVSSVVSGDAQVGGLVGYAVTGTDASLDITNNYATGAVTATNLDAGRLVGLLSSYGRASIVNSFWDTAMGGNASDAIARVVLANGGTSNTSTASGKTSAELKQVATFTGWDIANTGNSGKVWRIYEGHTAPLLTAFLTPLEITPDVSVTYSGVAQSGGTTVLSNVLGAAASGTNANFYASGYYSNQQGYDISGGNLTITQTPLTVTAGNASKTYDASAYNGGNGVTYDGFVNSEGAAVLGGSLAYSGSSQGAINAGSYVITPGGLTSGNYAVSFVNGTLTIDQRPITVTADAKSKTYGNAEPSLSYTVNSGSLVSGDSLGSLTRTSGEDVGSYTINAAALANGNYLITANNGTLTIDPRPITVTADAKSKIYGNLDPALTYQVTTGSLVAGDSLSGALTRTSGEDVGNYTINASALANGNYLITTIDGVLTIVAALPAQPPTITDPQPASSTAAEQAAITTAQQMARSSGGSSPAGDLGFSAATAINTPLRLSGSGGTFSGGLALVDVPGAPAPGQHAGSRDANGFMTVFVVCGGINQGSQCNPL